MWKELSAQDLKLNFDKFSDFTTTENIQPYNHIIGQKTAIESIELGFLMDRKEYNIYVSGPSGTGKTNYIINKINDFAKSLSDPLDWCYVYNFKDSNKPIALSFPCGEAPKFKKEIENFIKELFQKVPTFFDDNNYETEKRKIVEKYEKEVLKLSSTIHDEAAKKDFAVEQDSNGNFLFIPLSNGKKMDIESYNALSFEEKNSINESSNNLKIKSYDILKKVTNFNKLMLEEVKNLDDKISKSILSDEINTLKKNFGFNEKIINYLESLEKDIMQNIGAFLAEDEKNEATSSSSENEALKKLKEHFFRRYEIRLVVTNKPGMGAPVIYETAPGYNKIFGKIEYENIQGNIVTDFSMIRGGSLHLSNGGFLILNAEHLINNPSAWTALKRCIKLEKIILENSKNNMEMFPIVTLTPEPIPLKVKIILIGSNHTYSALSYYDEDFNKLFKIKSEFESRIENDNENLTKFLGFISNHLKENSLPHITKDGTKELLWYSCRIADSKKYFTSSMNKLLEVIDMANIFSKEEKKDLIDDCNIRKAIYKIHSMHGLGKKNLLQMYKEGKYIVELKGSKIGQINGLSVMNLGDSIVGQQHRITVTTFSGKDGVTNIEREAKMSGSIHNKGIMILSGFIGELIGQDSPLCFNANIVFEQLYSGIEGDSASAAELLALISSLSSIPIKQTLAITGSVNQKGEIQPIGGVNQKIEGYFDICSIFKLNDKQGVIIPYSNVDDLVLEHRVIESIEKGLFHIYFAQTIEECIDLIFDFSNINKGDLSTIEFIKKRILNKLNTYRSLLKNCK